MFKNKSLIGATHNKSDRFISDQLSAGPLSPLANTHKHLEGTFAKAKRISNPNLDKNATLTQITLQTPHSDHLNLQCDETLDILDNLTSARDRLCEETDENLVCEQQLAPIGYNPTRQFNTYVGRVQILLYEYMRRDIQKSQYIRRLQEQRLIWVERQSRGEQAGRGRALYWKA